MKIRLTPKQLEFIKNWTWEVLEPDGNPELFTLENDMLVLNAETIDYVADLADRERQNIGAPNEPWADKSALTTYNSLLALLKKIAKEFPNMYRDLYDSKGFHSVHNFDIYPNRKES
jgi:hypothetical protein